jgi:hypothetical protein
LTEHEPPAPHPDRPSPEPDGTSRRFRDLRPTRKATVATVGTVATLLAAIAGLITALTPWFGNGDGKQTAGVVESPATRQTTASVPERLIFASSLEKKGPFPSFKVRGCNQAYTDVGYRISQLGQFKFCDTLIRANAEVSALPSARVEATILWSQIPTATYRKFGAGDAALSCRGNGEGDAANGYFGSLTTSGHWEFNRYVKGEQQRLDVGDETGLASEEGETLRLRLDCVEVERGSVRLSFYVNGRLVGAYTDVDPMPTGLVGVAAASYTTKPIAVTFRELRIYGPST